ncbi:MAG: response regulator [Maritimibacter sp.]
MQDLNDLSELNGAISRKPTPERPLQGVTVLVVEDSRFASEAIRLLCLRSGARIRRADTLASAHRHLGVYRPTVVIVDMGLPDGSGADLIKELDLSGDRVPVILGLSGDPLTEDSAMEAGANGFLAKPVESLAAFQTAVLKLLPSDMVSSTPRVLPTEIVHPQGTALAEDLSHIAQLMADVPDHQAMEYLIHFLEGIAKTSHDDTMAAATKQLARAHAEGRETKGDVSALVGLVDERLAQTRAS